MNRIKTIREEKGIDQKSLAELANVSRPFLCDLENNRRGAKPDTLQRIADALKCTVEDLMNQDQ